MPPEHQVIDPENKMGFDFHAARALGRRSRDNPAILEFESITDPEARREAVMRAKFRDRGVHTGEAEQTRAAILRILDRLEGRRTPEQERLLQLLESQIEAAALVWTEKYPLRNAPAKNRLIGEGRKWLANLPPETLNGFLKLCPETAQFVVVPDRPVPELMKLIDGKIWWPAGWDNVAAGKWKCGITDSREDMPFDPSIYWENPDAPKDKRKPRANEEMVVEYERRFVATGLTIMPQHGYVPAAADALSRRKLLDRNYYTAFKRPPAADALPHGDWFRGRVRLVGDCPDVSLKGLRCRPWAEGEMSLPNAFPQY